MMTVCIATYNGGKFITRQVNSILYQLNPDDEIIVSDDNSIDDTLEQVRAISDPRIKIVINHNLRGPVGNFENALSQAKGNYILLADQDDIWLQNKVSTMRSNLMDYDLVISDCHVVDQDINMVIPSFFAFRGSQPGFWYNLYKNSYIGCCMGFRREILKYVLPFPQHIHMHDWWIGLMVERRGRVKFLPEPLINYVRHGDNASPTGEHSNNDFSKQLMNRLIMFWYVINRSL